MPTNLRAPMVHIHGVSEKDMQRCQYVMSGLISLGEHCDNLEAAIILWHRSQASVSAFPPRPQLDEAGLAERKLLGRWQFMACRDAVQIVFNFNEAMESIGQNVNKCPPLRELVDANAKRSATRAFAKYFPDFKGLRHSTAHSGKLFGTPESMDTHQSPNSITIINSMIGNVFTTTFEGKSISLPMDNITVGKLKDVRDFYLFAFKAADPFRLN